MSDDLNRPAKTPIKDLRAEALAHYDELSTSANHWLSVIPRAINLYYDLLEETESKKFIAEKMLAEAKVGEMFNGDLVLVKGSDGLLAAFLNYRDFEDYTPHCTQQEDEPIWDFFGRVIQENRNRVEKLEDLKTLEE